MDLQEFRRAGHLPTLLAPKTRADYAAVLKIADTGWFCVFYAITFGGFVGLVSFLGIFFRDQYFAGEIGVITGLVGAAGGLGGFVLPNVLGGLRQLTRSFGGGFLAFALVGALGAVALSFVGRTWEGTFLGKGGGVVIRPTPGAIFINGHPSRENVCNAGEA